MQYLLLIYGPEAHWATLSEAEGGAADRTSTMAFSESIRAQGIMEGGAPLRPVRRRRRCACARAG